MIADSDESLNPRWTQCRSWLTGIPGLIMVAACSGLLFMSAFPPVNMAEAAYVFAIPLLVWAAFVPVQASERWVIFGAAWGSWALLLSWLRHSTSHLDFALHGALGMAAVIALSGIVAAFWWLWMVGAMAIVRRATDEGLQHRLLSMLGLAAAWVVLEWIRTWLFTGFPWLTLATSQWERPLVLQVIAVTGAYGLSFILIAFNLGLGYYIWSLWARRREPWWKRFSAEFYLALVLLFVAIGGGMQLSGIQQRGRITGPTIAFVQPNVPAISKWDMDILRENLQLLEDLSEYGTFLGADWIIWPEAPSPLPALGDTGMRNWVESVAAKLERPLLIGSMARVGERPDDQWYNTVFEVQPEGGINTGNFYAKRRLVPFGEYVPFSRWLPFFKKIVPSAAEFTTGDSARPIALSGFPERVNRVGMLICYEDIFPTLARANAKAGADWHFVATNNAWFGEAGGAWQHAAHSVLRAVETRRPVVRCGNAGWSGWIDEFGHIRHTMLDGRGSIYFQGSQAVPISFNTYWNRRESIYTRYGDWFVATCMLLMIPLIPFSKLRAKKVKR